MMDLATTGKESKMKALKNAKWSPPDNGVIKVNVDASLDDNTNQGCTGLVIHENLVLYYMCKPFGMHMQQALWQWKARRFRMGWGDPCERLPWSCC